MIHRSTAKFSAKKLEGVKYTCPAKCQAGYTFGFMCNRCGGTGVVCSLTRDECLKEYERLAKP